MIFDITLPHITWDWWLGLTALAVSFAVAGPFVYGLVMTPAKWAAEQGYEAAAKESSWGMQLVFFRTVAGYVAFAATVAMYNWYTVSMAAGIWFWIYMDLPWLATFAYIVYVEDPKTGGCTEKDKDLMKKNLKTMGVKTGMLALAAAVFYCEFYNGTNYVVDSKHGLPAELTMMLGVVKNKFLKGH